MHISVGVMAHNEGRNIRKAIDSILQQELGNIVIDEIIVVSSGSTDNTNRIVKSIGKVRLITQKKREGKASAINLFLKNAKTRVLVMISADTLPEKNAIRELCSLIKGNTGIVAARPVPMKTGSRFMDYLASLEWRLHHLVSVNKPKFGEMIAFRREFDRLPMTAVDEEYIAMLIHKRNLVLKYNPKAVVYVRAVTTIRDFVLQRRRIYAGHLKIKSENNYEVPTLSNSRVCWTLARSLELGDIPLVFLAVSLEAFARMLGLMDFIAGKGHSVWKIAKSTKEGY